LEIVLHHDVLALGQDPARESHQAPTRHRHGECRDREAGAWRYGTSASLELTDQELVPGTPWIHHAGTCDAHVMWSEVRPFP